MIEIDSFNTLDSALLAQGMLESNGIHSQVGSPNSLSTLFPPGLGNTGIPLYVDEKDAQEARRLLSEHAD